MVNATTADLTKLVENLRVAKRDMPSVASKILETTAEEIADRMRARVPVKTGALRNSIRVVTEPGRVTVGPIGIPYAAYVEFGTGTRGEFARSKPKTNKTVLVRTRGGTWAPVKATGQKAQPYARPAAAEVLGDIGVPFAEAGARMIGGKK